MLLIVLCVELILVVIIIFLNDLLIPLVLAVIFKWYLYLLYGR